ncbi:META domain-containing protein [Bergeyella zoohelcum]|uniref:DUF306 domain-containing protein n=1 Tax=Bergeyella zoohelcum ATCC 43767 TaxID=883096 RepID=K1M0I4_9FLAO|nr:META domain-containing protein [Bergeyella zoohelcum]EKB55838.1 hypothetical protein HMPREF9699_01483 [Bergeyella zoohelcum ATCC 43767]SUV50438.1 heat-inducible protein [Bergeyella zoohelcum]
MRKILLGTAFSAALLATSCSTTKTSDTKKEEKLAIVVGTKWQLADATGTALPTIKIADEQKMIGNASCNNFSAQIKMNPDGSFFAKNVISTRMTCKHIDTEVNFLNMLRKANRYKVTAKRLELYQNEILLLKFNRMP